MVAAKVALIDTTMVPGTGPKMAPAVMVSGIAGTAKTSSPAYTAAYARYPQMPQSSTAWIKKSRKCLIWPLKR
jgi:hypothetical protein